MATDRVVRPTRQRFATADPEVAYAYMRGVYGEHEFVLRGGTGNFHFRTDTVLGGELSIGQLEYSMGGEGRVPGGLAFPLVMHQHAGGRLRLDHDQHSMNLGDDDLFLVPAHQSYSGQWDAMDVTAVGLSDRLLGEDAGLLAGHEGGPVAFDVGPAVSPAARGHWLQVQQFVARNLATNAQIAASALARRELIRLLNSATLACFPNSTQGAQHDIALRASPASVRRAVAYIEQYADTPLDLADLCAAARLSPRALQAAFRRHLDTTPLGYLRRVRLARVHAQLRAAQPGDRQTVAGIASRWGFTQPGRFAQDYRATYGTTPSTTLRAGSETSRPTG